MFQYFCDLLLIFSNTPIHPRQTTTINNNNIINNNNNKSGGDHDSDNDSNEVNHHPRVKIPSVRRHINTNTRAAEVMQMYDHLMFRDSNSVEAIISSSSSSSSSGGGVMADVVGINRRAEEDRGSVDRGDGDHDRDGDRRRLLIDRRKEKVSE